MCTIKNEGNTNVLSYKLLCKSRISPLEYYYSTCWRVELAIVRCIVTRAKQTVTNNKHGFIGDTDVLSLD